VVGRPMHDLRTRSDTPSSTTLVVSTRHLSSRKTI